MNPDIFFENFELLANAPNGVQRLRELILQLAVMGKLVPQDPNDEPASVLLEGIKAEKKKLIKEGKIKGSKQLPEISDTEVLFETPESWKWIRFDDICSYIQRGKSPKYVEESDFPVIAQKCIQWDGLKIDRAKFIDPLTIEKYEDERFLRTGDLLWNSTGTGTIGRVNVYAHEENTYGKVVADTHVTVVRPLLVDSCYIYCWIAGPIVQKNIENIASGSTNQIELATSTVKSHVLPLPPLAEQKRIVSKVDELITLCDKLEARRQKKQEIQSKLNRAALDRMLSAENQEEFEHYWQRICENFDLLYDNPENIEKLRQAILQLAVQGKLVEQNPEDEPASVLIEKIKEEKKGYAEKHNLREKELLPPVEPSEEIFKLPVGWIWSRIGEAFITSSGTTPKRSNHDYFIDGTENWVKTTDLNNGVVTSCEEKITPDAVKDCNLKYYPIGTVCVAMYGGAGTIGKSGILGMESTINQSVCGIYPNKYVSSEFLHCYVKSIRSEWMRFAAGLRKDPNINGKIIDRMVVPLPPLAEQKRIVEKVEQFMSLCDELEAKLRKGKEDREKLMEAVVRSLLEGAVTEKTELENPVPLQAAVVQLK